MCVCVCSSAIITHTSFRYYIRQARLVLCCLDGERVVGNDDNSVFARSDCSLEGQYEIGVSALALEAVYDESHLAT